MKPAVALVLLVVGAGAVAGGWYFGARDTGAEQETIGEGQLAFPALALDLDKAKSISLLHQGRTLLLERKGDVWGVADRGDYPVIPTRVHALLSALTELRLLERRTTNPEEFAKLGLEDPSATAGSTLVQVLDAQDHPIAALLVGHQRVRAGGEGTEDVYVRRPVEEQAWLAEGRLEVDTDPQSWFDRDITNIDHGQVKAVSVTHGENHLAFATEGDKLVLKEPADHKPLDDQKVQDVGRGLEFLSFTDVQPVAKMPGTAEGDAAFTLADGVNLTVAVNQAGADAWGRFDASGEGDAAAKAKALHDRFSAWAYKLPTWKVKALVPSLDDLLAPAPAAPPTIAPTPPVDAAPSAPPSAAVK
jgi:hypothetical protein